MAGENEILDAGANSVVYKDVIDGRDVVVKTSRNHDDVWLFCAQKENKMLAMLKDQKQNLAADITDKLKNWSETSLQDRKDTIVQAAKIFKYVYGMVPEIGFFTPEEEKARLRQAGLNENAHINAAFYRNGKICFNEERLQESDNYFAVSVLFHEGTHHRQETQSFDNPLVNRIFNTNINVYENELNNKGDTSYKDLYTMLPDEVHAYGIQEYMEKQLAEKTGIVKTAAVNKEANKIHNKALAMAKLAQYRAK